ncbi:N-acetylmuramoyl-L-alanine amidase family protein [Thermanaeromonas sp. C210]|uniref:N-acetylmuramoyl-L-alanine amidase family protein n=1 Tax=Thermanaeromonas sp. C210 TaxID=2731925 RepID=UPI00155B7997|nr:N-acetylmuramoyl-L-alanine amidase [Thermanaeromonas sp. C210]GFN21881.1 N-acetylmuramoyl-L-alanine amidase [Thermanaeromonas sp. C210]
MAGRRRRKNLKAAALILLTLILFAAATYVYVGRAYRERQSVEALSWAVAGQVVVVDPGHGGIDVGARGPGGTNESEVVLAISRHLAEFLQQGGARVFLTRQDDSVTEGESGDDLLERVRLAQKVKADLFISVHANAFDDRERGAQVFFDPASQEGRKLAEAIQAEIRRLLKNTDREALGLDAFVLRTQEIPAVIVEVGFLSNPQEEKLLADPSYQREMAFAIYAGIASYLGGS